MTLNVQRVLQLAARAALRHDPRLDNPRQLVQDVLSAALDEILSDAFGGEAHEIISLRNKDHLKTVYDFQGLFRLADGGWAEILDEMDFVTAAGVRAKGRNIEDDPAPILPLQSPAERIPRNPQIEAAPGAPGQLGPQDQNSPGSSQGCATGIEPSHGPGQPPTTAQE